MARPKKETIDYFPHYVAGGKTLFILENSYSNDGYAFWFKLLEILGSSNGHFYDTRNPADWRFLIAKTRVREETATEILNTLADLDAIDKELWTKKIIWVQHLVDNVADVYRKRCMEVPKKPITVTSCDRNPTSTVVSDSENTQSKVKESKVKESKVEKSVSVPETHTQALDLCKYYEQLKPGENITAHLATLKIWIEKYGFDWTKEVIQICVSNKNRFIVPWIEKVLQNWQSEGKPIASKSNYKINKPSGWNLKNQRALEPGLEEQLIKNSAGEDTGEDPMEQLKKLREGG
jgi:hypothetical protein